MTLGVFGLLHGKSPSCILLQLSRTTVPARAWEETREDLARRRKGIVRGFKREDNVKGLCRELPQRLVDLVGKVGAKLSK